MLWGLDPDRILCLRRAAFSLARQGELGDACAVLEVLRASGSSSADLVILEAKCREDLGDEAVAESLLEAAERGWQEAEEESDARALEGALDLATSSEAPGRLLDYLADEMDLLASTSVALDTVGVAASHLPGAGRAMSALTVDVENLAKADAAITRTPFAKTPHGEEVGLGALVQKIRSSPVDEGLTLGERIDSFVRKATGVACGQAPVSSMFGDLALFERHPELVDLGIRPFLTKVAEIISGPGAMPTGPLVELVVEWRERDRAAARWSTRAGVVREPRPLVDGVAEALREAALAPDPSGVLDAAKIALEVAPGPLLGVIDVLRQCAPIDRA
jgi:hypothetical protein